jgi:hypothetical protein
MVCIASLPRWLIIGTVGFGTSVVYRVTTTETSDWKTMVEILLVSVSAGIGAAIADSVF